MRYDLALTELLSAPFTLAEAAERGIGRPLLRRLGAEGAVRRVAQGVYVGAQVPDSRELRARAMVLAVGRDAVVCGRTAAALWGVAAPGEGLGRAVELAVPPGAVVPRRTGCRGRVMRVPDAERVWCAGVPVTTPLRTALDVAREVPVRAAVPVLDGLLRLGLVGHAELGKEAGRLAKRTWGPAAVAAVRLADGGSASWEESVVRLAFCRGGHTGEARGPLPIAGWEARSAFGRRLARLAFAWPEFALAVDLLPRTDPVGAAAGPRVRRRNIGGQCWRVLECDAVSAAADPSAVMAWTGAELRQRSRAA